MKRIKFVRYKNNRILFVDSSNCTAQEALELFHNSHSIVKKQPKRSLLSMVNIDNVGYNWDLIKASQEYLALNKPYLKRTAVFNANYLHKFVFNTVIIFYDWGYFNSSSFGIFDSMEEAKDWLIDQ